MLGGAPVRRSANEKQVDAIARLFENRDVFRMVLAPEGTRKKVDDLANRVLLHSQNRQGAYSDAVF